MKFRKDFVTNSSSSSFVCEICGSTEGGYDVSPSECGFTQCERGHMICEDHVEFTKAELIPVVNKFCDDCEFDEDERGRRLGVVEHEFANCEVWKGSYDNEVRVFEFDELPVELCPICSMRTITDADLLKYILHNTGTSRAEFVNRLHSEFAEYNDLKKAVDDED